MTNSQGQFHSFLYVKSNAMRNEWAEEWWLYASRLFKDEKHAEGRNVLEAILEEDPGFGRAHSYLGWFYYTHMHDYRSAMTHLDLAIRFSPDYAPAYFHLVIVLMERRMYGRLLEIADAAMTVDGTDEEWLWEMRGHAMSRINRYSDARVAYNNAIRLATNDENTPRYRESVTRINARERVSRGWIRTLFL